MKVFISWSGERSKIVAESLRNWIPKVIQAIHPWMSKDDISSGSRWSYEIFKELEETKFGIICVTPENQHNPWILFEAGALSKSIDQTYVVPYLYDMKPQEIIGPLVQFQTAETNRIGTYNLITALNKGLGGSGLNEAELKEVFDVWWHKLEEKLLEVPKFARQKLKTRTEREILNEILENTREQLRKEEIRLNSMHGREDGISDVLRSFQKEFTNLSGSSKPISHLINQENEVSLDVGSDFINGINNPFNRMIEIIDEQKDITQQLLYKQGTDKKADGKKK